MPRRDRCDDPHVEYLAHHWILLAVPAFLPAIIVVAVVLYVALQGPPHRRQTAEAGQRHDADEKRD